MRALITGITGFVGGHLAEHLLAAGDEVLGTSTQGRWHAAPVATLASLPLVAWDLAQPPSDAARRTIADFAPEVVYHLAAVSLPQDCDAAPERAQAINVGGTLRLAELCAELATRPRIAFTSTSRVYGPATATSFRFDENAAVAPARAYGHSKLAAERALLEAAGRAGLQVVVARAFQHTGPRQEPRVMLPEWCAQFVAGGSEPVRVRSDRTLIDLSDVRDVVRAYRLLASTPQASGIYNVGSGVARWTGDVLTILRRLADPARGVVVDDREPRYDPVADVGRLQRATGWRQEIPLESMIRDTLDDWRGRKVT